MRDLMIVLVMLFNLSFLYAQNSAPQVTNVTFSQRGDGSFIVDVYYDLNDADGDTMSVLMLASADSGSSWNFSCDSISGDLGCDILSGNGKHIEWDFGSEHADTYGDQFRVKIYADDSNYEKGKVSDIDGNIYITTKIGNQWWMAENLKVTRYRNGESIPNVTDDTQWTKLITGAYCAYNNDNNNVDTYGLLYNWYAVNDSRSIAPEGWHVTTDEEWKQLEMYLGMSQSEADDTEYRGTDEGGKLKATGTLEGSDGLWYSPNVGATNESGFSALPGGYRYNGYLYGTFFRIGDYADFWSSTEYTSGGAWYRRLDYYLSDVVRGSHGERGGFSVRCVRD